MEQLGARRAHNPKVTGSSPVPATREKPVSAAADDWLFAFPEALIACFQKQMEMQKDSAFSAWLFLVKPPIEVHPDRAEGASGYSCPRYKERLIIQIN